MVKHVLVSLLLIEYIDVHCYRAGRDALTIATIIVFCGVFS